MKLKFIEMMPKAGIVCDERLTPFRHGDLTIFQYRAEGQLYLAVQLPLGRYSEWFAVFRNESGKRLYNDDVAVFAQMVIDVYCAARAVEVDRHREDGVHRDIYAIDGYDRTWSFSIVKANYKHMAILLKGASDADVSGCEKAKENDLRSEKLAMKFAYEAFCERWPGKGYGNAEMADLKNEFVKICPEAEFGEQRNGGEKGFTMKMHRKWFFCKGTDGNIEVGYEDLYGTGLGIVANFDISQISPMAIAALDDQLPFFTRGTRLEHINKLLAAEAKARKFEYSCLYIDGKA